jgi:hypothetical protein
MATFSYQTPTLEPGSHVFVARAESGERASGISEALEILVDPDRVIDAGGLFVRYDLDGTHYVQPYQNAQGCLTLRSGDWMIRPHPPDGLLTLHVPVSCPSGATPTVTGRYNETEFAMQSVGGGSFEGAFDPEEEGKEGGPLSLNVACGSDVHDILLGTVAIEYNGIVFDEAIGPQYGRIRGAVVTLWVWDTTRYEWVIWAGDEYFGQTNPQTTGLGGWYGFYPQPGYYRAHVSAAGFDDVTTAEVTIKAEPFVENVPMTAKPSIYLPATYRVYVLTR